MLIKHHLGFVACEEGDGGCRIRARLSMPRQGRVAWWMPSVKVGVSQWDTDCSRFKGDSPAAKRMNGILDDFSQVVASVFSRYEIIEKRLPSISEVKDEIDEAFGFKPAMTINKLRTLDIFDMYVTAKSKEWSPSTSGTASTLRKYLANFDEGMPLCDVDDAKLSQIQSYLTEKVELKNTSVHKFLSTIKFFLRWAYNNGYYNGNSHNTFKLRIKGVGSSSHEVIYCTRDEVRQLMGYTPSDKVLEHIRDVFLFCCFTGLRYSDVAKLRRCDVHGDEYISVVTQKTSDALRIELNKYSTAILHKYADETASPRTMALPVPGKVTMNARLKDLGKAAGLDTMTRTVYFKGSVRYEEFKPKYELLTTHCGRRTFVVSALQLGIPPEVIMRWTGHSSYEAMKPYIAIVDELKRKSMDKFDLF